MSPALDQAPVIQAGALRSCIQIQAQTLTPDATTGAPAQMWNTVRTTRAKICASGSKEFYQAGQFVASCTHLVMVRWTPTPLEAGMRVLYGTREFAVQDIDNVKERNVQVNLACVEIDGVTS